MPRVGLKKCTALGVHIFAGGFTCGVKQAGFNVLAHLEDSSYGVDCVNKNWPGLEIRIESDNWKAEDFQDSVDFVYSNPPCAIFSTAGISTTQGPDAWRQDPRLGCWYRALHVFKVVRPKCFVLESVCQAYSKGKEIIDEFSKVAVDMGYSVQHLLMDAKWTGVAQSRKRFFLVFHKPEIPLVFDFDYEKPLVTIGEVLSQVQDDPGYIRETVWSTDPKKKRIVEKMKQGEKLRVVFDREEKNPVTNARGHISGRPSFLASRLDASTQMGVFIGDVFWHPTEHRSLGVNEMKAICSYPQSFQLVGSPTAAPGYLARAVMPEVGRWIGNCIRTAVRSPTKNQKAEIQFIDLRKAPGFRQTLDDIDSVPVTITVKSLKPPKKEPSSIKMTGFTRAQAFPRSDKDLNRVVQKIDVPAAIATELTRQGVDLDWSVPSNDPNTDYDGGLICIAGCTSLHGIAYAAQALYQLWQLLDQGKPCVIFYDDWKIHQTQAQINGFKNFNASMEKRFKQYSKCDFEWLLENQKKLTDVAEVLVTKWPDNWTALCPMYSNWGNRDQAFSLIPAETFVTVDATPAVIDLQQEFESGRPEERWCLASLGDHRPWVDTLNLEWPVTYAGHRKSGERLKSESDVIDLVHSNWASLSPGYPQAGSGWFRARYVYSAIANRVIFADPAESQFMGEAYRFSPTDFENMSNKQRFNLARRQREWLLEDEPKVNTSRKEFEDEVLAIGNAAGVTSTGLGTAGAPRKRKKSVRRAISHPKPIITVEAVLGDPTHHPGEGSGAFVRRLMMERHSIALTESGGVNTESLVRLVRSQFAGRKTTASDVRWNWYKLRDSGTVKNLLPWS